MGNSFEKQKLKINSKGATERLKLLSGKRNGKLRAAKREVAQLVADGKLEKARIQMESVIREENTLYVYDLLMSDTMMLSQRGDYIDSTTTPPNDMLGAFATIFYCQARMGDVTELKKIAEQLVFKYGEEWASSIKENATGRVPQRIVDRLAPRPPSAQSVEKQLAKVCEELDVAYEPREFKPEPIETKEDDTKEQTTTSVLSTQHTRPMPVQQHHHQAMQFPPPQGPYHQESVDRCLNFLHNPMTQQFTLQQKTDYLRDRQQCAPNDIQMAMHIYTNPHSHAVTLNNPGGHSSQPAHAHAATQQHVASYPSQQHQSNAHDAKLDDLEARLKKL